MKVQLKSGFMGLLLSHIGAPTIHTSSTVKARLKLCLRFAILLCAFSLQHAWAQTGTITIVKVAQPHDAQDFNFYAFGPHSSCCMPFQLDDDAGAVGANNILSNTKTWTLAPGSYSFKEDFNNPFPVTGWNLMSISCLPASSATVDLPNHAFTANLTAGHHITCTFTNKKVPSTPVADLSVTKTCAVNGPQSVLCTVTVTNLGPLPSVSPISISDLVTGAPSNGIYTGAGGTLPISCSPGAGPILPIACTANTSLAPSQSKNALFSFKLPSGGSFMNCVTVTEGASPGTPSDPNPANNTHICASVTVPSLTGTVTVKKILVPATDPGKFTLQLKNSSGTLLANFLNGGNGAVMGPVTVPTGNYNVSEVGGSNGTSLANYTSAISGAGCAANGAVTVAAGDNKFCTITNTRNGSSTPVADLSVTKTCAVNGPQSVLCTVTVTNLGPLPSVSPISISDIVTGAPSNGIYTGAGGTLPISCSPGAGPILPIACTANTSLAPSQSKNALFSFKLPSGGSFMNCVTVTEGASPGTPSDPNPANNTHICASVTVPSLTGTVTVKKILVPATDPGKFTLQLKNGSGTLLANFLNGGNGAVMGPVTVPTGNYNVSEVGGSNGTSLANYTSAISGAGCAANGAVTVAAGDNKFCTITNTRNGSSWPLSATVTIYNPMTPFGPQSVDIAVGGTVTFHNSNSGANWTILRLTGPTTFGPVPLPNNTTHATGIFTTAGTYTYQINGTPSIVVHGTIIVH